MAVIIEVLTESGVETMHLETADRWEIDRDRLDVFAARVDGVHGRRLASFNGDVWRSVKLEEASSI